MAVDGVDLTELAASSHDAVVFCLLLEYLPLARLRYAAVQKAALVLKPHGLLLIVTPDSSHQAKNLGQMRAWRLAMARAGLVRVYVDKLRHVHCLAYAKVAEEHSNACAKEVEMLCAKLKEDANLDTDDTAALMFIPQDKTTRSEIERDKRAKQREEEQEQHHVQNVYSAALDAEAFPSADLTLDDM